MTLVDAHRPPERHALALVDASREVNDRPDAQAGLVRDQLPVEPAHKGGKIIKARGVGVDEVAVDPAVLDQDVCHTVEQRQVALGQDRQVERAGRGGLGPTRVDDDDLGIPSVPHHPFPEDRMGDAEVRADEDKAVRLFEVLICVRRSVEAERLLVSNNGRGHALPGVAVAVDHAHAELGQRAEQRHLFGRDLARTEERDRVRAMLGLDRLDPADHRLQRGLPVDRRLCAVGVLEQGDDRAVV